MEYEFYKQYEDSTIWYVEEPGTRGKILFSFDKKKIFSFFKDYPQALTEEQKKVFDKENPDLVKLKN